MLQHSFALEIENGVDDVLERLGAGDAAAFGDVPNGEHRCLRLLGEAHQARGAFPHLADVAGRAFEVARENGLN